MPEAVIAGAVRTAVGKRGGGLSQAHPVDLSADVLTALAARTGLDPALVDGDLDAVDAAKTKLFCTEMQGRVVDRCLQLFGGYGYTMEFPIARLYADARVTRIYGGTSEVMKSIISKSLGLLPRRERATRAYRRFVRSGHRRCLRPRLRDRPLAGRAGRERGARGPAEFGG